MWAASHIQPDIVQAWLVSHVSGVQPALTEDDLLSVAPATFNYPPGFQPWRRVQVPRKTKARRKGKPQKPKAVGPSKV